MWVLYQEALYVCAEILTTVGYGDLSPSSYASQAFCTLVALKPGNLYGWKFRLEVKTIKS